MDAASLAKAGVPGGAMVSVELRRARWIGALLVAGGFGWLIQAGPGISTSAPATIVMVVRRSTVRTCLHQRRRLPKREQWTLKRGLMPTDQSRRNQ